MILLVLVELGNRVDVSILLLCILILARVE